MPSAMGILQAQIKNESLNNSSSFISYFYISAIIGHAEPTILIISDNDQLIFSRNRFILLRGCGSSDLPSLLGDAGLPHDWLRLDQGLP